MKQNISMKDKKSNSPWNILLGFVLLSRAKVDARLQQIAIKVGADTLYRHTLFPAPKLAN